MASPLAESALRRRFFIGPLIALALVGAGRTIAPILRSKPNVNPSSTASPTPSDLAAAVQAITKAHDAEGVYYVDNLAYASAVGDELKSLQKIEPGVRWNSQVFVELPTREAAGSEVVILRAPLPNGGSLCMSEVSEVKDAGTWYARVTGRAHCPPRKTRMPGWTEDQRTGWRT